MVVDAVAAVAADLQVGIGLVGIAVEVAAVSRADNDFDFAFLEKKKMTSAK